MQRRKALAVQPAGALAQRVVMGGPGGNGVVYGDARGGKDGICQTLCGLGLGQIGEHAAGPGGAGVRQDIPVDVEIGDLFQSGFIGDGIGLAGAGHFFGVLFGQKHWVVAHNRQPRRTARIGLRHALVKPICGTVECGVLAVLKPGQCDIGIAENGCHHPRPGAIGGSGDAAHQGQGLDRGGQHQVLARLQV